MRFSGIEGYSSNRRIQIQVSDILCDLRLIQIRALKVKVPPGLVCAVSILCTCKLITQIGRLSIPPLCKKLLDLLHRLTMLSLGFQVASIVIRPALARSAGPERLLIESQALFFDLSIYIGSYISVSDRERILLPDVILPGFPALGRRFRIPEPQGISPGALTALAGSRIALKCCHRYSACGESSGKRNREHLLSFLQFSLHSFFLLLYTFTYYFYFNSSSPLFSCLILTYFLYILPYFRHFHNAIVIRSLAAIFLENLITQTDKGDNEEQQL